MNYLLDTHVVIWSILDRNRLSKQVINELENSENGIFVSSLSFWEISLKFSSGKLKMNGLRPEKLPELVKQIGFEFISLSPTDASSYNTPTAYYHKDPFDRMLIWQAIQQNLTLVTKDERIQQYSSFGLKTLW